MHIFLLVLISCLLIVLGFVAISLIYILMMPRNNPTAFLRRLRKGKVDLNAKRIVCIGDSITHGHVSEDYVKQLRETLESREEQVEVINAGINSEHTYNVVQRLDDIIACEPEFVSILIGTNDSNNSINAKRWNRAMLLYKLPEKPSLSVFRNNLEKIILRLKEETRAKIAILSLPTNGENPEDVSFKAGIEFNEVVKELAISTNIEYLPLHEQMVEKVNKNPANSKCNSDNQDIFMIKSIVKHRFGMNYEKISKDIGCTFHVDFLHLNLEGATLIVDLLEDFYFRNK
ncbi:MAG: SGNH/GDSL hydrolase family protein [Candidatus Hodarchaeota archaeon]